MQTLRDAVREVESEEALDPQELSSLIDRLQAVLCRALNEGKKRGDHLVTGQSPCAWAAGLCRLSPQSATDRLRVGAQMHNLPRIAEALSSGEIGYQSAALLCHLSDQLGEKRDQIDEELWVDYSKRFSIKSLRYLTEHARYVWDAESVERDDEEDYEQRYLHLSEFGRMYKLDAVLDRAGGAALRVRSTPWPSPWASTMPGRLSSAGRMPWWSWFTTPWTRAPCLAATACARTSASTPRSKV